MPSWIWITAAAIAGYVVAWRLWFRIWWEDDDEKSWSSFWSCLVGTFVLTIPFVAIAPFFLAFEVMEKRLTPEQAARKFAGESRKEKLKRKEKELADARARVERMERELGIVEDPARNSDA